MKRALFDQHFVPTYAPAPMVPVHAQGVWVTDQEGRKFLDLAGGIAVSALGHCHPSLVSALTEQAQKLWHVSNLMTNEPALKLAQGLCQQTFAERVFFSNSGAEANEAALKLARRYAYDHHGPAKHRIICFEDGFHGRTLFTVSAGGQAKYREGFGPTPSGIEHLPYNDVDALRAAVSDDVCAIFLEPMQGEGGMRPATPEFLRACREEADRVGASLIFDEVQSGMGRTGHLFAYQHYGVTPDILSSAKALGCGYPIGAMLTTHERAQSLTPGTHGTTSGGNPLACAVAFAALNEISQPEFLATVRARTEAMRLRLEDIGRKHNCFTDVRGLGLWFGCELTPDRKGSAGAIVARALDHELMILNAGPDVVRLAPALNISEDEMHLGLDRLEQTLSA